MDRRKFQKRNKEICLLTDYPKDYVLKKLGEQPKFHLVLPMEFHVGINAKVYGDRFQLYHTNQYLRNSFQRIFYGSVEQRGEKTILKGRFRVHPFVTCFMLLWFGLIGLFTVLLLLAACADLVRGEAENCLSLLVIFGLCMMGIALVWIGRRMSKSKEKIMIGFLKETLNARPVDF